MAGLQHPPANGYNGMSTLRGVYMTGKTFLILGAVITIAGCATLGAGYAARDVEKAVELINTQNASELSRHSSAPFLFDGEMLLRRSDIEAVWLHLTENGFKLKNPVITETTKSDDATYKVFLESQEMEIFFRKYIPADSTLGRIDTDDGVFYLLLGRGVDGTPRFWVSPAFRFGWQLAYGGETDEESRGCLLYFSDGSLHGVWPADGYRLCGRICRSQVCRR